VRQRNALDRNAELRQPHTVRLQHFTRTVHLFQYSDLFLVQRTPLRHPALQGAELALLVLAGMLLTQPGEQRFGF